MSILSARAIASADAIDTAFRFFSSYRDGIDDRDVRADLTFGNPHEMPLPALVAVIRARTEPKSANWFAYKTSEAEPRTVIAAVYSHTLIDYSYGKILLAPGLRIGYLALGPSMPEADREALRAAAVTSQVGGGWNFPDAPLQYAVGDLARIGIDIGGLQRKRDRLHGTLTQWGYGMTRPEGTFYLWGRAPGDDSVGFTRRLAEQGVFVTPGTLFDRPADFRISLTGAADMIDASLPAFEAAAHG